MRTQHRRPLVAAASNEQDPTRGRPADRRARSASRAARPSSVSATRRRPPATTRFRRSRNSRASVPVRSPNPGGGSDSASRSGPSRARGWSHDDRRTGDGSTVDGGRHDHHERGRGRDRAHPPGVLLHRRRRRRGARATGARPRLRRRRRQHHLRVQALVVDQPGRRVLVDPCVGNDKQRALPFWHEQSFPFLERFAAAGFDPGSIDVVVHTHLHADHVGWDTQLVDGAWTPTFTGARHLYIAAEVEFLRANPMPGEDVYADSVGPIVDAGLADFVDAETDLGDGLRLEATPGHTPGHVSLWIESCGETTVVTGDFVHHPTQSRDQRGSRLTATTMSRSPRPPAAGCSPARPSRRCCSSAPTSRPVRGTHRDRRRRLEVRPGALADYPVVMRTIDELGHPVFDADNHYYEALDAFTRHLDPRLGPRTRAVGRDRRPQVPRRRRAGEPRGREPDVRPDRQARRAARLLPRQPRRAATRSSSSREREPIRPEYRDRDARLDGDGRAGPRAAAGCSRRSACSTRSC